jgi:integrase
MLGLEKLKSKNPDS